MPLGPLSAHPLLVCHLAKDLAPADCCDPLGYASEILSHGACTPDRGCFPTTKEGSTMSGTTDQFEGGCLCGAIRFVATGQPKGVAWCHCESCRKHSGAPVSVFVAFERTAYTVTKGEITKFDSTPGKTRRGFCARCGSTLTCETVGLPTLTDFHVGAFDRAELFGPTRHIFSEERLPWLHIVDA
jgi:hypothetical protein